MDGDLAQAVEFLRMVRCKWIGLACSSRMDICNFIKACMYLTGQFQQRYTRVKSKDVRAGCLLKYKTLALE